MFEHPKLNEEQAKQALANAAKTKKGLRQDDVPSGDMMSVRDAAAQAHTSREWIRKEQRELMIEHLESVLADVLKRRCLTDGQKAALGWEKLKGLLKGKGRPKKDDNGGNRAQAPELTDEIAEAAGRSVANVMLA